jgi:hypothetical protein
MTLIAGILYIVMDQGEIVDELDGCRRRHYPVRVTSRGLATEKTESGANKLA